MPRSKRPSRKPIPQYEHEGQTRLGNPPVGMVTPENAPVGRRRVTRTTRNPSRRVPSVAEHRIDRRPARYLGSRVRPCGSRG